MYYFRPRFLTLVFTASLLLWASIVGTPATAAPIPVTPVTFAYTGTVRDISSGLLDGTSPFGSSPYVPGSLLLTGVYTFNSSTPNPSLDPTIGFYLNTILSHTFQLRDLSNSLIYDSPLSTTSSNSNFIQIQRGIQDQSQQTFSDYYDVVLGDVPGSEVNGNPPVGAQINLSGPQGIFNSVELPTTPPSISSFTTTNQFVLQFFSPNTASGGGVVIATITSITPVPLPPAVILFGAGLVALVGLGAGRWRQKTT